MGQHTRCEFVFIISCLLPSVPSEYFIPPCQKHDRCCCEYYTCSAVVKVLALEHGIEQIAVGTVYKDMKLKPTALKEYTEDITMAQQLAADTFCDDDDGVVLEDETARIKLSGNIDVGSLVTGIIIGLRGVLDEKAGVFVVEEQCFAGLSQMLAMHDCSSGLCAALH